MVCLILNQRVRGILQVLQPASCNWKIESRLFEDGNLSAFWIRDLCFYSRVKMPLVGIVRIYVSTH